MLKLRLRHILCILGRQDDTYQSYQQIFQQSPHTLVYLTEGGDDICQTCQYYRNNQCLKFKASDKLYKTYDLNFAHIYELEQNRFYHLDYVIYQLAQYTQKYRDTLYNICLHCQKNIICKFYQTLTP
jgi:hypothetical protein